MHRQHTQCPVLWTYGLANLIIKSSVPEGTHCREGEPTTVTLENYVYTTNVLHRAPVFAPYTLCFSSQVCPWPHSAPEFPLHHFNPYSIQQNPIGESGRSNQSLKCILKRSWLGIWEASVDNLSWPRHLFSWYGVRGCVFVLHRHVLQPGLIMWASSGPRDPCRTRLSRWFCYMPCLRSAALFLLCESARNSAPKAVGPITSEFLLRTQPLIWEAPSLPT